MSRIVSDITFRTRLDGPVPSFQLLAEALTAVNRAGGNPASAVRGRDLDIQSGVFAVVMVRATWLFNSEPVLMDEEKADKFLESLFQLQDINAESLTSFSQSTFDPDPATTATVGPPTTLPPEPGPRSGFDAS